MRMGHVIAQFDYLLSKTQIIFKIVPLQWIKMNLPRRSKPSTIANIAITINLVRHQHHMIERSTELKTN